MMSRQQTVENEFLKRKLVNSLQNRTLLTAIFFTREADGGIECITVTDDANVSKTEILEIGKYLLTQAKNCAEYLDEHMEDREPCQLQ